MISVRGLRSGDRGRWQQLYTGYGEFYDKLATRTPWVTYDMEV